MATFTPREVVSELDARAIVAEAMRIAAEICVYTNDQVAVEELEAG